ncbi:MAG TPA: N-acetylmuramoyl-L-alanine amidase, partial [Terriglobia bacterium]|nr:N-acetylmuramoyl-L-alanine amidase [Terriglobia bacterium]
GTMELMNRKICLALLALLAGVVSAFAQSSTQQASAQFRTAERLEASLKGEPETNRSRADYLRVIRAYERVYLITPHTAWADNALTTIARLYEEMNDPRNAVKTLQFLLHDYPQTPFRDMAKKDIARLNSVGEATPKDIARPNGGGGGGEATPKETAAVENVRFFQEERNVRIVVDLSGGVSFREGEARSPDRFFVDITPARLSSGLTGKEWVIDSKVVQKVRVAQYDLATVRIVLDGATMKSVDTANLKDPSRLVLDVADLRAPATTPPPPKATITSSAPVPPVVPTPAAQPAVAAASTPAPVPAPGPVTQASTAAVANVPVAAREPDRIVTAAKPSSLGDRSLIRSLGLKLSRVVIDAGHGGHDTGSIGPTGFTEKELVLDVARRLKTLIEEQMGTEAVLTRDSDVFVALENRTLLANQEKADLFISIHANSSPEKGVRGVETFFLNLNTQSRDALATATRENAASEKKIHELQDILQKIVLNDKADESRELAKHVQSAMSARANAGSNRGVKQAPFVVLVGATMPSILAEISFISNPEEEKRLKTPEYRQKIAESLYRGIKSYAETLSSTRAAN